MARTTHTCDFDDHPFTGQVFECRTSNWLYAGDMVCVMHCCRRHARRMAGHTRAWWQRWLRREGAALGYTTLS